MVIREYKEAEDFEEICRWAREDFEEKTPTASQFSPTTFVAEVDGIRAGVLSVLLTNCKHYCIPECLFTNPDLPTRVRKTVIENLALYVEAFAKALEYKGLFCVAPNKAMKRHYEDLGYRPTLENTITMYKVIGKGEEPWRS